MKLHKSRTDKMLMGVCGGIAESFNISSNLVRLVFVLLAIFTRIGMVGIYLIAGLLMPYGDGSSGNQATGAGRTGSYRPEDPPFDISDARDVDIDNDRKN